MALPQPVPHATLEVLDTKLEHVQGTLEQILRALDTKAPKTDVDACFARLGAIEARLRPLEDYRTSAQTLLTILGTLGGLLGVGGIGALLKWILAGP